MFSQEMLADFNDLELSIYNCIIRHKEHIAHITIKELADEAHVSTATVQRFCKKAGCDGYSHFKLCYKEYLQKDSDPLKVTERTAFKSFASYIDSGDFEKSIEKAFQLLSASQRIIFIGVGSSGILGKYGARFFSNVGCFSLFVDDPWLPILQEMDGAVTIALSVSGVTRQTLNLANQMKLRGSRLISITNTPGSALSRISDCNIYYHLPLIMANHTNITTQVPVIYILETLAGRLYAECTGNSQ